jgi:2-amino-4-hydroxy-6-hydroxymethyldihydropteridine diphosphokinase
MRAGIAFGSNVGDRLAIFKAARERIEALDGVESPVLESPIYETTPVDCEPGAPPFLNAVVEIGFTGSAAELLRALRGIERDLGRPSVHRRNVSRTIDLDLLYVDNLTMDSAELQLPHPRIEGRAFVLRPLADIRPDLVLPNQGRSIAAMLQELVDTSGLVRFAAQW